MRALAIALIAALTLAACAREATRQREEVFVFGTRVELTVVHEDAARARAAVRAIAAELYRLHQRYHAWQPSELTALNEAIARGKEAKVSAELAGILADAQQLAAQGEYLFDPGLGAVIAAWGFHRDDFASSQPLAEEERARWRSIRPSIAALTIEPLEDGAIVRSSNPHVRLDLGGYLKGYALDRAAAIVRAQGIGDALINIGGNVLALGRPEAKRPWRVALQHPRAPGALAVLPLYDGEAIGTSGDYQRYFEHAGRRYHHLIDPRTMAPSTDTQAFTVLITARDDGRTGVLSDATSKAPFLAGDDWPQYAVRYGLTHALRVRADGSIEVTPALRQRLQFVGNADATVRLVEPEAKAP